MNNAFFYIGRSIRERVVEAFAAIGEGKRSSTFFLSICAIVSLSFPSYAFAGGGEFNVLDFSPHAPGNQWSFTSNNNGTKTMTFGNPVSLPNGVVALPAVVDGPGSEDGTAFQKYDSNCIRTHKVINPHVSVPN